MKVTDLTSVILTHRNDTTFIHALASVQFSHQVIVIDNNSNNDWKKLLEKYNFTVITFSETLTDFSKARNLALKSVKTTWVLFLDSDEIIPKEAIKEIDATIKQNFYDAIAIGRVDYFLGKPLHYGEVGNISLIRLFKVQAGKFSRNVHETVDFSGKLGLAHFHILHFSHSSLKVFFEKITRYALLESKNKSLTTYELLFQMCTFPIGKFMLNYFFKLGFLDGYRGFIYALLMSLHSFFVRVFTYERL